MAAVTVATLAATVEVDPMEVDLVEERAVIRCLTWELL